MKTRWPVFILLAVLVAVLFLPAAGIYVHSRLGEEAAALFPEHISLWDIAIRGNNCLPTDAFPALALPDFCQVPLIGALLLTAAAIFCTVFLRKGSKIPLLLTGLAVVLYGTFLAQWGNLSGSLLFVIFLKLQAWIYIPLVILAVLLVFNLIDFIRHGETALDDRALRLISGVLAVGILLVAALVSAGTWEKGLPYLFLYVTLSLTLLRLLRHDDRVARSRRFRILNLTGVALYAIQWILYGASWLFTRLFGNVRLRELDLSGLDMGGPAQPMFSQAESAVRELPLLVRLAIQGVGIALLAALAFLVLRAVSRRVVRTEMSSGGSDQRESLDDGPALRGARFSRRDPVDGVRRQYRRVLTILRARGGRVTPAMNTQQIQQENVHIADPGALKAIRDVYLPVRYGGRAASSQDVESARIAADRIRKS